MWGGAPGGEAAERGIRVPEDMSISGFDDIPQASYTVPALTKAGVSHATANEKLIDAVRARGKSIWAYTYPGTRTPSFTATEPLADSQLFFLWVSLENIRGVLYGDGTTTYQNGVDPFESVAKDGAFVLLYPGKDGPVPSARLEQVRDGIENWEILNIVRSKHGSATVRKILGVGPQTADRLKELGLETIRDLQAYPREDLVESLGGFGEYLVDVAFGRDSDEVVEPTGPFEDDPNVTDKRFPGNPTRSYRTTEPLRVVEEVAGWKRPPPEMIQQMRERKRAGDLRLADRRQPPALDGQ